MVDCMRNRNLGILKELKDAPWSSHCEPVIRGGGAGGSEMLYGTVPSRQRDADDRESARKDPKTKFDSTLHLQKAWRGAWRGGLKGGFKGASRGLTFVKASESTKGAWRELQGNFKGASRWRGLEGRLKGARRGAWRGLEGGAKEGLKGAWRRLEGGLKGAWRGAWRGLEGGLKGAWTGFEGGFKVKKAWRGRGLNGAWRGWS